MERSLSRNVNGEPLRGSAHAPHSFRIRSGKIPPRARAYRCSLSLEYLGGQRRHVEAMPHLCVSPSPVSP
jgi:hypothetical protein